MFVAVGSLTVLGLALGFLLGYAARYLKVESDPLIGKLEAMLPGSQCGQCGYVGCAQAAEALAKGQASITLCPPGGKSLAEELAATLGVSIDLSKVKDQVPALARVNESICVGCTRCFKVCPTDAIVGGPKQIHAVISVACTGCGKCVDICPTEALQLHPIETTLKTWRWPKPAPELALA